MIQHPSPNCGERRDGQGPELIVLHYTAMQSAQAALDWLCNPEAEVSAHYLIGRDGSVWQMVADDMRAWHAGAGSWQGRGDVNSRSIGIELDNDGFSPFVEAQMVALEDLLHALMKRHGIAPDGVIGHSDMAPGRKIDPGARFDWLRLEKQGLAGKRGIEPVPNEPTLERFRELACGLGYPEDLDDGTLLSAIRLRYRPWGRGALTSEDVSAISKTL